MSKNIKNDSNDKFKQNSLLNQIFIFWIFIVKKKSEFENKFFRFIFKELIVLSKIKIQTL
jgi:hypothetical protein